MVEFLRLCYLAVFQVLLLGILPDALDPLLMLTILPHLAGGCCVLARRDPEQDHSTLQAPTRHPWSIADFIAAITSDLEGHSSDNRGRRRPHVTAEGGPLNSTAPFSSMSRADRFCMRRSSFQSRIRSASLIAKP